MGTEPVLARQALRALLAAPIGFTPDGDGYRLRGATKIGALWEPETRVKIASPRGLEPRYCRERAVTKKVAFTLVPR